MNRILFAIFTIRLLISVNPTFSQEISFRTENFNFINGSIHLKSQFCIPENVKKPPLILIIAGSGPTDMDGNNIMLKNDHLRLLSESLAGKGIATLRYNKRTVPANDNSIDESELQFGDFVNDATFILSILKKDKRFGKVAILGHSQGALIATLAAQKEKIDRLFLVAGPGEPISRTIVRQVSVHGSQIGNEAKIIVDSLMAGHSVTKVHPMLINVFRPSVQDFMISWMKYNPSEELQLTKTKKVIIQGETDIQVRREDAMMLKDANPRADVHFINDMNHIMKVAPPERMENLKTYSNPELPVSEKLIEIISSYYK